MNMKAYVFIQGDWSVGIPDWGYTVEVPDLKDFSGNETRKFIREALRELYVEIEGHKYVSVIFEDECWDCGRIGCKGECLKEIEGE